MANLYHVAELPKAGEAVLEGPVAHHLARVLRVQAGEVVQLSDGRGRVAAATVQRVERAKVVAQVGPVAERAPLRPQVTLAFACPRSSRADWLIEHGTEVGVAAFQPVWTARSRPQRLNLDRWNKIGAAAAGQCARAHLPQVREPVDLDALLASSLPAARLIADVRGDPAATEGGARDAVVLIGPEGGFTPAERAAASGAGFAPLRLGPHILRTETAALLAAATLLRAARSDG
ncbi:MAG: RsmE family RNA methyltransferase [Planctomycetota bacterium]